MNLQQKLNHMELCHFEIHNIEDLDHVIALFPMFEDMVSYCVNFFTKSSTVHNGCFRGIQFEFEVLGFQLMLTPLDLTSYKHWLGEFTMDSHQKVIIDAVIR